MLQIFRRELRILLRDKIYLILLVLFPIGLVFLLGNMLTELDMAEKAIEDMTVYYAVETRNVFDLAVVEAFVEALGETDGINLVETEDLDPARLLVERKAAAGAIHFAEPLAVELYEGLDNTQNRALATIVSGFSVETGALRTVAEYAPERLYAVMDMDTGSLVADREFNYSRSMLDYYAVVMLVMILFMGGSMYGANMTYDGRRDGTLARVMTSPKSRVSIYIQSVLGILPINLLQITVIMVSSTVFFGARYADTWGQNALLIVSLFMVALAVNAIFSLAGLFIRVNPTIVIMPFIWVIMFISGTFSKEIYIEGVTNRSPVWLVQQAAFDLTVFGRVERCLTLILICSLLVLVCTTVGALLYRRKEIHL